MDLKVFFGVLFCVMICGGQVAEKALESAQQEKADDDSDMYMEPLEEDHKPAPTNVEVQAETGHWFPSFSRSYDPYDHPPSGHSRPVLYNSYKQQEGAYSQRNDPPFQQHLGFNEQSKVDGFNPYAKEYQEPQQQQQKYDKGVSLLGDGNFGVIAGGTFYPEKDGYDTGDSSSYDDFSSYFHNGHGRPSYFLPTNPKPGKQQQFDNFRDFADINTTPERQYSQYVVVYSNKNGTRTLSNVENDPKKSTYNAQIDAKRPKNILESLALLDSNEDKTPNDDNLLILTRALLLPSYNQGDIIDIPPEKKLSKSKTKLAKLAPEKKHEAKLLQKAKELNEPMLALS
ncbi:unnamed protein product [Ceutorhynchus assimilis]|uniref:Uncharacterized protein n=1 Tax=Ceutorhynchus assimilis TaxID=467358 RepID=A0A9N9MNQ4_9CUCU|nr:unnamed protein product [Ceutorhynchus assimilis]